MKWNGFSSWKVIMDFNLIRLDIERELLNDPEQIMIVLGYTIGNDEASHKKAFLLVNGIYQAIDSDIRRGRRMSIKWNGRGEMFLVIESLQDAKRRGKEWVLRHSLFFVPD